MKVSAAVLAASLLLAAPTLAAPPPASAFGRIPAVVQASISPDGQKVAILGGASDQRFVSIATIDQPGLPVLALGAVEAVDLTWAGDKYVIARVAVWQEFALRVEYRFERNVAIDTQAHVTSQLLRTEDTSRYLVSQPVLGVTASDPVRVMVKGLAQSAGPDADMNTRIARKGVDNPFVTALWSVDPVTGKGAITERGGFDTFSWELDSAGHARVRLEVDELTHNFSAMGRAKGQTQWSRLWSDNGVDSGRYYYGYSEPDDAIYLYEGDMLLRRKLAGGATETLGGPYAGSSVELIYDRLRNTAVGITTEGFKPDIRWFDSELGGAHSALSKVFKDKSVVLANWSADRTRMVAKVNSPNSPAVWYLFDRTRKELSPLGEEYPELKGVTLGQVRWFTYKARDGLEIPAYLTLPPGAPDKGARLPLVVLPHGGPAAHDSFEFDFLAQFIASRGYAVLQPQFRGSTGFGEAFREAGRGEWGGKMQDDLLDGIAATAVSGDIDPARVCIVGASYGGYAALAGVTMHPEAYKCAASIAGVADLGLLLVEKMRIYGSDSAGMQGWRRTLGDASLAKLNAASPARLAANVRAPVLLIHGDKDTIVPFEQSQVMADAMKAAGKPVELVTLVNENHYLTRAATRTQMLQALEGFLAKNLPVAAAP
jgi:dipeptidyl aminopeptidase/acylaminoacyl peptidase